MSAGDRRWNREPVECANCGASTGPRVDQDNAAQTHGWHQQLGIDIYLDACARRPSTSVQPGNDRARCGPIRGIERHHLPPRKLHDSTN